MRFVAKDANGVEHVLTLTIQAKPPAHHFEGAVPGGGGLASIRDQYDRPVNRLAKGRYQTLAGVELTSDDPNAP